MQMGDIAGGIGELLFGQFAGAPVGALLLLRQFHAQKLAHQIFQAMPVGIGAHQLGSDLGAIDRLAIDLQILPEHPDIEAREMKQLGHFGIGEQALQIGRRIFAGGELHRMADAVARRQLRQAEPVAEGIETEGFGIDCHQGAKIESVGQIALVQFDFHAGNIERHAPQFQPSPAAGICFSIGAVILADGQNWRLNGRGLAASALLHLAFVLLLLWWHFSHPLVQNPPLKTTMVDLVTVPVIAPKTTLGPAGGSAARVHTAAPRTTPKPLGVTPKAVTPPPDALEARIRGFANLSAPDTALPSPDNDGPSAGAGSGGGYALADFVRAQILRRWWPDLGIDAARGMAIAMTLKMTRYGVISDVRVVDQQRFVTDKVFRNMAISARNAAANASPIALPPGHYDAVMDIAITLDPKAVLR